MHLNQVTLPTVFIVDEGVALLPVEVAQHAAVLHPGDIAQHLGLCHQNIVIVTMSQYISNRYKTSGQQNVLVSYKSLEQILLIVPSSYRMQQQDEDNKFSYGHG